MSKPSNTLMFGLPIVIGALLWNKEAVMIPRNLPLKEEVEELKAYYEDAGKYAQAQECEELLTLFCEMKMIPSDWKRFKELADQNRLLKVFGEIILY